MNKYKVAESIVGQIIADLEQRLDTETKMDLSDETMKADVADKWEDIVIAELEKQA